VEDGRARVLPLRLLHARGVAYLDRRRIQGFRSLFSPGGEMDGLIIVGKGSSAAGS